MKITLHYQDGYKGQVKRTLRIQTPIRPNKDIKTDFIEMTMGGILTIIKGYAYDFASGPTLDWPEWIKAAALPHDCICQLHREGYLNDEQRREGDEWFKRILKANGMFLPRREIWYRGVRIGSGMKEGPKPIHHVDLEVPE